MPFIRLSDIEEKEMIPGFSVRFIHTENMTFAYFTIKAGAALSEHAHPHEQVTNITAGELELTVDGEAKILRPGDVAVIPPNAPHSGKAMTDCRVTDVFYPVREDYRS